MLEETQKNLSINVEDTKINEINANEHAIENTEEDAIISHQLKIHYLIRVFLFIFILIFSIHGLRLMDTIYPYNSIIWNSSWIPWSVLILLAIVSITGEFVLGLIQTPIHYVYNWTIVSSSILMMLMGIVCSRWYIKFMELEDYGDESYYILSLLVVFPVFIAIFLLLGHNKLKNHNIIMFGLITYIWVWIIVYMVSQPLIFRNSNQTVSPNGEIYGTFIILDKWLNKSFFSPIICQQAILNPPIYLIDSQLKFDENYIYGKLSLSNMNNTLNKDWWFNITCGGITHLIITPLRFILS